MKNAIGKNVPLLSPTDLERSLENRGGFFWFQGLSFHRLDLYFDYLFSYFIAETFQIYGKVLWITVLFCQRGQYSCYVIYIHTRFWCFCVLSQTLPKTCNLFVMWNSYCYFNIVILAAWFLLTFSSWSWCILCYMQMDFWLQAGNKYWDLQNNYIPWICPVAEVN